LIVHLDVLVLREAEKRLGVDGERKEQLRVAETSGMEKASAHYGAPTEYQQLRLEEEREKKKLGQPVCKYRVKVTLLYKM
jgi:hypothetical protein